jgi:hypothetical protein
LINLVGYKDLIDEIVYLFNSRYSNEIEPLDSLEYVYSRFVDSTKRHISTLPVQLIANDVRIQMIQSIKKSIVKEYHNGDLNKIVTLFGAFTYYMKEIPIAIIKLKHFAKILSR